MCLKDRRKGKGEKNMIDYSKLRGFNYTPSNIPFGGDRWESYDHEVADREMAYAERLRLNSARVFLSYASYYKNPALFLANVQDFVRTAWSHGVSTNPIIFTGFRFLPEDFSRKHVAGERLQPLSQTIQDKASWVLGEKYFDDLLATIGEEPGLLFWDISNEPGYSDDFVTWYDDEPEYLQTFRTRPDMTVLRDRQEKTWEIVRHFCKYVKTKDPRHDIGVGNIFIFETERSEERRGW